MGEEGKRALLAVRDCSVMSLGIARKIANDRRARVSGEKKEESEKKDRCIYWIGKIDARTGRTFCVRVSGELTGPRLCVRARARANT